MLHDWISCRFSPQTHIWTSTSQVHQHCSFWYLGHKNIIQEKLREQEALPSYLDNTIQSFECFMHTFPLFGLKFYAADLRMHTWKSFVFIPLIHRFSLGSVICILQLNMNKILFFYQQPVKSIQGHYHSSVLLYNPSSEHGQRGRLRRDKRE